jgi:hypothetical protein
MHRELSQGGPADAFKPSKEGVDEAKVNMRGPATGSRIRRLLPVVLILAALASGCASGGGSPSVSPTADHSVTRRPGSTSSPAPEGATPDERFQSWMNGGGGKGAYSLWSSGQLGGGPPAGATEKERRALFEEWLTANMDVLRAAWDRSQVLRAESSLRQAMAVALTYHVEHGGFAGMSASWAEELDPALEFNTSETVFGEVSIRNPTPESVVLTTESGSGQALCIAYDDSRSEHQTYGTKDAQSVSECVGGGWL